MQQRTFVPESKLVEIFHALDGKRLDDVRSEITRLESDGFDISYDTALGMHPDHPIVSNRSHRHNYSECVKYGHCYMDITESDILDADGAPILEAVCDNCGNTIVVTEQNYGSIFHRSLSPLR